MKTSVDTFEEKDVPLDDATDRGPGLGLMPPVQRRNINSHVVIFDTKSKIKQCLENLAFSIARTYLW